jgi:thioredoxin-related protein
MSFDTLMADIDDSKISHIEYPDWFKISSFFDLEEDLDQARLSGKQGLMVLFTTEGCSYCDMFIRESLGNPDIASIVQDNFDTLGAEIFDDTDMTDPRGVSMSIKEFSKKEGVEFSPTLLFFNLDAERILRVVGYQSPERFQAILSYVTGMHYQNESLANYFARLSENVSRRPSVYKLKEDSLFEKPPYALDRSHFPANQPLLVIFEKPGCVECEEFHDSVLSLKEVRSILKEFEIVRLDATDDKTVILAPNGNRLTPKAWFNQAEYTRTPALLFFDEKGNEVLKTDALVLRQRMMNSLYYVLERAYEKGWTYQQLARSKAIKRRHSNQKKNNDQMQ